ncbi:aspartate aminotransferase [Niveomyces insectorum RCEF 264]|uniref:Aspartate aminotransferase n=1 Tax=Niveomyces insectorum RCEF 264 TaxID=1081102 RepID=A0A167LW47_9HYPO|nr:aspartate aminotransferase [Niveomyces insectorum RCEF 264]
MFEHVPAGPVDPFFHLKKKADEDCHPDKVDVGVGIYRNENGLYQELEVVKKAKKILDEQNLGHDYGLTTGDAHFLKLAAGVVFGPTSDALAFGRVASVQTLSGSGANHLAAVLLARSVHPKPTVYFSGPGWSNTKPLFEYAGLDTNEYAYLDGDKRAVDFAACLAALNEAPAGSVFVVQGCCHNPTGKDFTAQQWRLFAETAKAKGHLPLIDIAYQGLGDGLDEDAVGVHTCVQLGLEVVVCQSFAKNFALYGERCGVLHVVTTSATAAANVKDQLRSLVRREYSSPPAYGSRLVSIVLSDPQLREEWVQELGAMRKRLQQSRKSLQTQLQVVLKTPGDWKHITEEKGLFT